MESNINNPATHNSRVTPRNSDLDENAARDTPWRTLNLLANIPRTPLRRASSAGPPSTYRSQRRTPATRTPAAAQRIGSARRQNVVTPHGRAAQRDMDIRRAGLTPGNDRRRGGRQQRETPRDGLRALSRLLAPITLPIVPTPQGPTSSKLPVIAPEDWEDGPELERPRLSLPWGEDDEDDSLLLPPQSAGLEDENFTLQSVEFGRRARSEQPFSRLSRGSFGSILVSDGFDDSRLDRMSEIFDSSIFPGDGRGDIPFLTDDDGLQGEYTGVLRGMGLDRGRISLASGRDSDIRPLNVDKGDDTENTFVFNVPSRAIAENSSPLANFEDFIAQTDFDSGEEDEQDDAVGVTEQISDEPSDDDDEDPVDALSAKGQEASALHLEEVLSMVATEELVSAAMKSGKTSRKKKLKISKYGLQYPSIPAGVVKKLATTFARTAGNSKAKLSKDSLDAIMQASDWFFEQASEDLTAYAMHAGRVTIDENDVVALMARQRQTNATTTPFSLAQRHLPRELLQELRMVPPSKAKAGRKLQRLEEDEGE